MKRFSCAAVLGCILVASSPAVAPAAVHGGSISGSIDENVAPPYGANDLGIESEVTVTARDATGALYGSLSFGKPTHDDTANVEHVPFTISGLPLGTPLVIVAGPHVAANPSPAPAGMFMTFTIRKEHGDSPPAGYTVTLTPAAPRATGIDFVYAAIEVPPALPPGTPAPRPSSAATP